ncbi:MAG: amino acid-binding protein, partial [Desulfobacteraceae bacterium]|nr:amino acid-binding protein [Desulfobacteraceae bacterium]
YNSMRKDSAQFALIRLLAEDGKTNAAIDLLSQHDYTFDIMPVIAVQLDNKPGELARLSSKFGEEGININYVYGSVAGPDAKCLFVFCPEDIDLATKIFAKGKEEK